MNFLNMWLIISLVIINIIYFLFTRRLIKRLLTSVHANKEIAIKAKSDLYILTEQYRQLANINKALRDIRPKGGKK